MTVKQFAEGLSALDDRYIAEAAEYQVKHNRNPAARWIAVAASLVLVAALGIAVLQGGGIFGDTVKLENGAVLRFEKSGTIGASSLDMDVTMQALPQTQLQQLFPDLQVEARAIFLAENGSLVGIEGSVGEMKLLVSCSDMPLTDTVLVGEEATSTVDGVAVTAGRFVTDKNSRGERTAIYYASFHLGESTFYLENAGNYGAREAVKTELADVLQTLLKNGEPNWSLLQAPANGE